LPPDSQFQSTAVRENQVSFVSISLPFSRPIKKGEERDGIRQVSNTTSLPQGNFTFSR